MCVQRARVHRNAVRIRVHGVFVLFTARALPYRGLHLGTDIVKMPSRGVGRPSLSLSLTLFVSPSISLTLSLSFYLTRTRTHVHKHKPSVRPSSGSHVRTVSAYSYRKRYIRFPPPTVPRYKYQSTSSYVSRARRERKTFKYSRVYFLENITKNLVEKK